MYSQICVYIQNMETVAAVINVQSDMCLCIYNMERVAAVINIHSNKCVYTEYGEGSSGN